MGGYGMTREEEIKQMANVYTKTIFGELDDFTDITDAYIDGAKWANETIIAKACNWIKEHTMMPYKGEFEGNEPLSDDYLGWCEDRLKEAERIVNEFKKAMES